MVFGDLSDIRNEQRPPGKLAPVADRVLSVAVDIALFWPIFTLLLSGLLRKLQYRFYSSPDSTEFWVYLGLAAFGYAALTILLQGMFWSVLGFTPGQYFFQLRVVNIHTRRQPSLPSAWLRAFLFGVECLLLCVPLLEVFSHPKRRPFHDRASDTEVITLKAEGMDVPHRIEAHFIRSFFTVSIAFVLMWAFSTASHFYRKANRGAFKEAELSESSYLCEDVSPDQGAGRLDAALAMHQAGVLSSQCLALEIDFAFWKGEAEDQAWASFANAVLNDFDPALSRAYLDQTCMKSAKGAACRLARWWSSDEPVPPEAPKSWTRSVLGIGRLGRLQKTNEWERELEALPGDFDLYEFVEAERIKLFWAQGKLDHARGGYRVVSGSLSDRIHRSVASELCFSELTRECQPKAYLFCQDLEKSLSRVSSEEVKSEWVVALAEMRSCKRHATAPLVELAKFMDPASEGGSLVLALLPDSGWSESRRLETLRKIAFAPGEPSVLKSRALVQLIRRSRDHEDLEKSQNLLATRGFPFQSEVSALLLESAAKKGFETPDRAPAHQPEEP